jgi:NAD(P)-dependent dehydrogenase (short-subunit alcohol dehydrogenase family)
MAWTLVTGGARRLGSDLCVALARSGHDVVVHYRSSREEALSVTETCRSFGVESAAIPGDFSSPEGTDEFIERYLSLFPDTKNIVNNVGNYLVQSALGTETKEWLELFQTNVHAPFALIKALSPSLIIQKGNVVNLGIAGMNTGRVGTYAAAYQVTKCSLWALTRSLAKEMASFGVRVNMVSPGYLDIAVDLPEDPRKLPMGRPASCEEVSRVVTFLLGAGSEYITGQNIEVAGAVGI